MNYWRLVVFFVGGVTSAAFCCQFFRLLKYKKVRPIIIPRGSMNRAALYALTRGLLPWEKESTRRHYLVYGAGLIYHSGIFGAFLWLASLVFSMSLPQIIRLFLAGIISAGAISGLGLFGRRVFSSWLRSLSYPDDFVANLLVDSFLATAAISLFRPLVVPLFLILSILLILYLPLGKIRHCVLFFPSRLIFGRYFGQRDILPPIKKRHEWKRFEVE